VIIGIILIVLAFIIESPILVALSFMFLAVTLYTWDIRDVSLKIRLHINVLHVSIALAIIALGIGFYVAVFLSK
jgi:hypothetical protein